MQPPRYWNESRWTRLTTAHDRHDEQPTERLGLTAIITQHSLTPPLPTAPQYIPLDIPLAGEATALVMLVEEQRLQRTPLTGNDSLPR